MERKEQKKHDRQRSVFSSRGKGSRNASYAVHTPPIHAFFSLFSCPYKISQQSHSYTRILQELDKLFQVAMHIANNIGRSGGWDLHLYSFFLLVYCNEI